MKKYYKVSFQYSESVYCSNIAHAETVEDVEAHYSKYPWVSVSEAADCEVRAAQRKGMPIVECDHIEPEEPEEDDLDAIIEANEAETVSAYMTEIRQQIGQMSQRSAWDRGVTAYAVELVDGIEEAIRGNWFYLSDLAAPALLRRQMLNGAEDWSQYSWGGCSLIYDQDIAERLCTPSELAKTRHGQRKPNSSEAWLDTQARALYQAAERVQRASKAVMAMRYEEVMRHA